MCLLKRFTPLYKISFYSNISLRRQHQLASACTLENFDCKINIINGNNNNNNNGVQQEYKPPDEDYVISSHPKIDIKKELLNTKEHYALPRCYYTSREILDYEMEHIFKKNWLFAGHTCEIPENRCYFVYNIRNHSVIIVRGKDGQIRAFKNTCRHRGYRITTKESGMCNKFMCGYHRWQYDLNGNLINAGSLDNTEINFNDYGLYRVGCKEVGGLIFIHLGGEKYNDSFDEFSQHVLPHLQCQNLKEAKIVLKENIIAKSNWKLLIENNRDCDHCVTNHPEYNRLNYDVHYQYDDKKGHNDRIVNLKNEDDRLIYLQQQERISKLWKKMGLPINDIIGASWPGEGWYRVSRAFLKPGYVTQTVDGKPGCNIMLATIPNQNYNIESQYENFDMGALRCNTYPNFWMYCLSDHAASTRLTPIDALHTLVTQYWLVHKDAKENVHFNLNDMKFVWQKTLDQDVELCERNQLGINDESFIPGPYSKKTEAGVNYFVHGWYMKQMRKSLLPQEIKKETV